MFTWFKIRDLPSYLIAGALATLNVAGMVLLPKGESAWAYLVMALIIAGAVTWSVTLAAWRYTEARAVDFITSQGVEVVLGGFKVTREEVENEIERVIFLWGQKAIEVKARAALRGLRLAFRELPFEVSGAKLAGAYWPSRNVVEVGYNSPLATTAMAHELGHAIYAAHSGNVTEVYYLAYAQEKGLP